MKVPLYKQPAQTHRGDRDRGLASEESEANLGLRAKQE